MKSQRTKAIEQKGQVCEKNTKHGSEDPPHCFERISCLLETLNKEICVCLRLQNVFESLCKLR